MQETERTFSRRDLIRGAVATGTAGAGVAASGSAAAQTTHTVDMTDELVFEPDELTIAPGDTVVWENVGTVGHSVTAYEGEIPEEADFFASGGFDGEQAARDGYPGQGDIPGGESYEYTFDVEGVYDYFCIPHETVGMVASLEVTTESPGGEEVPTFPESAFTAGVVATLALLTTVFFAYFFLKYGGDYAGEEE